MRVTALSSSVLWSGLLSLVWLSGPIPAAAQATSKAVRLQKKVEFQTQSRVALVIGVGNYPPTSDFAKLQYSANDAQLVAEGLKSRGYTVRLLINEEAGTQTVREALEDLRESLPGRDGTLIFYFSGHGFAVGEKMYLATHGTTLRSLEKSGLALEEVEQLLVKSGAKRRMLWLDACRNRPAVEGSRSVVSARIPSNFLHSDGLRRLFSTGSDRPSFEYDDLKQGVFTHFLVRGLHGEAAGADGLITFNDLKEFITREMRTWTMTKGRVQIPYEGGEASGDFLIAVHEAPKLEAASSIDPPPAVRPESQPPKVDRSVRIAEVRRLHADERWRDSIPLLDKLAAEEPRSAEIRALRCHAYGHLERGDEAVAEGQEAVRLGPAMAEAYLRRGEALSGVGKHQEALKDYDRAQQLDPNEPETWGNRGNAYFALGQNDKALENFHHALRLKPDLVYALTGRGQVYMVLQQFDKAVSDLTKAGRLKPDEGLIYGLRGSAYIGLQQWQPALDDLNLALKLVPDQPDLLYGRAVAYVALGNREAAKSDAQYALRLRPGYKEASALIDQIERSAGSQQAAVPSTRQTTNAAEPQPPASYARLMDETTAAIRAGRSNEAAEFVAQMIRLDPARADGYTLQGMLAMNVFNNLPAAYQAFEAAIARGGGALFRVAHNHGMDQQPCFGSMTVGGGAVQYQDDTGAHTFTMPVNTIQEAAINGFFGSGIGMFHLKVSQGSKPVSINFVALRANQHPQPPISTRPEAEMILGFINRQRQGQR